MIHLMWSHQASRELLDFAEEWLDKWVPHLEDDKKLGNSHYIGDCSNDAQVATELILAFMIALHGNSVKECFKEMFRNGNAREFMKNPEVLWDLLDLPPEDDDE